MPFLCWRAEGFLVIDIQPDNQPTKLGQVLNAFTAAALLISGLLLLSAFYVEEELVRAFCLGIGPELG